MAHSAATSLLNAQGTLQRWTENENINANANEIYNPIHKSHNGDIYTRAWVNPAQGLAQAGHGLVHLRLLSCPDLMQKFQIIIAANTSSICCTSGLMLCVPGGR